MFVLIMHFIFLVGGRTSNTRYIQQQMAHSTIIQSDDIHIFTVQC